MVRGLEQMQLHPLPAAVLACVCVVPSCSPPPGPPNLLPALHCAALRGCRLDRGPRHPAQARPRHVHHHDQRRRRRRQHARLADRPARPADFGGGHRVGSRGCACCAALCPLCTLSLLRLLPSALHHAPHRGAAGWGAQQTRFARLCLHEARTSRAERAPPPALCSAPCSLCHLPHPPASRAPPSAGLPHRIPRAGGCSPRGGPGGHAPLLCPAAAL